MTGNRLQKILEKNGWSQSQLAEVVTVPVDTIRKVALKEDNADLATRMAIVEGLNQLAGRERFSLETVFPDIRGGGDGPS